jgi:hypothetical protein
MGGGSRSVTYQAPQIPKDDTFEKYLSYQQAKSPLLSVVLHKSVQKLLPKRKPAELPPNLLMVDYALVLNHSFVKV